MVSANGGSAAAFSLVPLLQAVMAASVNIAAHTINVFFIVAFLS
jgi:hypothetical protein